jgi:hypothetical protein
LESGVLLKLEKKLLPQKLTEIQDEVLVGSLLGDGCLFRYKPIHKPYFCVLRKSTDRLYSEWEASIFGPFICKFEENSAFDKRTKKIYKRVIFRTHRTEVLVPYYEKWYPSGEKIVPDICFTPLSLAVWFADDGFVRSSSSPWRMRLLLSTQGFKENEVEKLVVMLTERYNEKFTVGHSDGKPIINASDNGTRMFLKEIDPYFPPGMDRKTYWRRPEAQFYENIPTKSSNWR